MPPVPRPNEGMVCGVEGCLRKHLARGMCRLHYYRWKEGVIEIDFSTLHPYLPVRASRRFPTRQRVLTGRGRIIQEGTPGKYDPATSMIEWAPDVRSC